MGFFTSDPPTDRYGRYELDVDGAGAKPYTRVTTIARVLEDEYHLHQWEKRCVLHGLAQRNDLVIRAAVTDVADKKSWSEIITEAEVLGGGTAKRNLGSAFHAARERPAVPTAQLPPAVVDTWAMYGSELIARGLEDIATLREVRIAIPSLGIAGTADGFMRMPDGTLRVLDCKSGSTNYPHGFAVQLALYAHAEYFEISGRWMTRAAFEQAYGSLGTSRAMIVHVTVGDGTPEGAPTVELLELDIYSGWQAAMLALQVREWRRRDGLLTPYVGLADPRGLDRPGPHVLADPPVATSTGAAPLDHDAVAPPPVQPATASPMAPAALDRMTPDEQAAAQRAFTAGAVVVEPAAPTGPGGADDQARLLELYKTKPAMQAAARRVDPNLNVARHRAKLAGDMVAHPRWAAVRAELLGTTAGTGAPTAAGVVAADLQPPALPTSAQLSTPNAQVPAQPPAPNGAPAPAQPPATPTGNPFGAQPAPEPVPAVQPTPEEQLLMRIASATSTADLAVIWQDARDAGIPWEGRLDNAAQSVQARMQNTQA
jgi:hypothetical protein